MSTTTKSGAGVSRYLRLYGVLAQALAAGRFGPGEALPSEPQLMRNYDVSRSTVRRALARLEAEGRIERRRGSGTYAREQGREEETRRSQSPALDDRAAPPAGASSRTIAWQRIRTPGFLLAEKPAFGEFTVLIRRIRYFERQPFALETAYLAEAIGGELTRPQFGADGSAMLAVLAALGHPCPILEREFAAIEADPLAARSLGLAVGAPLFNVRTLARDVRRGLVACINCLYRPDRYEARTVIDIGDSRRQRAGTRN